MSFQFELNPDEQSEILKEWDKFVWELPQGNIFQTSYMYKVYLHTKNYKPLAILLLDDSNKIEALLLSVKQNFGGKIISPFASRSLIIGGPLINNTKLDFMPDLIQHYDCLIKKKVIFTEIRNLFTMDDYLDPFKRSGYSFQDHLNIFVDLNLTEDELWKQIDSKRRNEIRRAYREGTVFAMIDSEEELLECFSILKEVYRKAKLPLPDFSFFNYAWKFSRDTMGLRVFCAKYESKIIGTIFTLYFKDTIYDYYAGSLQKYYNKYPNDLIPWELFRWAKGHGFKYFDFGGAGKPNVPYGVRDYKNKFGGKLVNLGRFKKIHHPIKMHVAELGFKSWRFLKGL